jgi:hypothetical protein
MNGAAIAAACAFDRKGSGGLPNARASREPTVAKKEYSLSGRPRRYRCFVERQCDDVAQAIARRRVAQTFA